MEAEKRVLVVDGEIAIEFSYPSGLISLVYLTGQPKNRRVECADVTSDGLEGVGSAGELLAHP